MGGFDPKHDREPPADCRYCCIRTTGITGGKPQLQPEVNPDPSQNENFGRHHFLSASYAL
jgi:hypothetical protein